MKFSLARFPVFSSSGLPVFLVAVILFIAQSVSAQVALNPDTIGVVDIPDPNLESTIRDQLNWEHPTLPPDAPITQQEMLQLTVLEAWESGITNLTGLEYATNLRELDLRYNPIADLRPLAHLIQLERIAFWGCQIVDLSPLRNLQNLISIAIGDNQISDLSPLAGLTNLVFLGINNNNIVDFSPLANLINLKGLWIQNNWGSDLSPLHGLNLTEFEYGEPCHITPPFPLVRERIANRSFPSIVQAWSDVVGLDHLTEEQRIVLHDLHFSSNFQLYWNRTATEPTYGLATQLGGNLERARELRQWRLDQNPNMVSLLEIRMHGHNRFTGAFPPDSDFWLRDVNGQIVRGKGLSPIINILKPEVQNLLAKRIIAVDQCSVIDGIFLDGFLNHGIGWKYFHPGPDKVTDEEVIQAYLNIFRAVRAQVRDDFLILINVNASKPTRYTEFINGIFMETGKDHRGGYSREWLQELESTLSWAEEHVREPRVNCLEAQGLSIEPPDGPNNLRGMRLITTLSLTHSDGYVLYTTGFRDLGEHYPGHDHLWHSFWDANLGQPVGPKAQPYQNANGLFIREFTNGWAVYNRSGNTQTITLPLSATPVSNRGSNAASQTHLLPDLDGEIYLTTKSLADINADGQVNVLDLVQIANSLGKSTPDPNGDGVVDILDLAFVTQQFSQ